MSEKMGVMTETPVQQSMQNAQIPSVQPKEDRTEQLLEQLVAGQKKTVRRQRIIMYAAIVTAAVIFLSAAVLVPKARGLMKDMQASLVKIDSLADDMEEAIQETRVAVDNANALVESNADALTESVQKFQSIDFETLNKAITDLSDAVEPLARFAKLFG